MSGNSCFKASRPTHSIVVTKALCVEFHISPLKTKAFVDVVTGVLERMPFHFFNGSIKYKSSVVFQFYMSICQVICYFDLHISCSLMNGVENQLGTRKAQFTWCLILMTNHSFLF